MATAKQKKCRAALLGFFIEYSRMSDKQTEWLIREEIDVNNFIPDEKKMEEIRKTWSIFLNKIGLKKLGKGGEDDELTWKAEVIESFDSKTELTGKLINGFIKYGCPVPSVYLTSDDPEKMELAERASIRLKEELLKLNNKLLGLEKEFDSNTNVQNPQL